MTITQQIYNDLCYPRFFIPITFHTFNEGLLYIHIHMNNFLTLNDWVDSLEELLLHELVFFRVTLIDDPMDPPCADDAFASVFCSSSEQ